MCSMLFTSKSWSANNITKNETVSVTNVLQPNNPFTYYLEILDGQKLLRVSFNANEGNDGTLKVYNAQNTLVTESNFELIKSPFYATVDLTALSSGTYTLKLTTAQGEYVSTLTIQ